MIATDRGLHVLKRADTVYESCHAEKLDSPVSGSAYRRGTTLHGMVRISCRICWEENPCNRRNTLGLAGSKNSG